MPPRAAPVPQSKNTISKTSLVTLPASPVQIRTVRVREISCLRLLSHTLRGGASRSEILLPLSPLLCLACLLPSVPSPSPFCVSSPCVSCLATLSGVPLSCLSFPPLSLFTLAASCILLSASVHVPLYLPSPLSLLPAASLRPVSLLASLSLPIPSCLPFCPAPASLPPACPLSCPRRRLLSPSPLHRQKGRRGSGAAEKQGHRGSQAADRQVAQRARG